MMAEQKDTSYIQAFGLANILTILRMVLIPVFVIASVYQLHLLAFAVFVVAGTTDFLDGYIARYTGHVTDVGKFLDPMADKVMLVSVYVVLVLAGIGNTNMLPVWVTILVIFRDVFIAIASLVIFFTTEVKTLQPSIAGKLSTFIQITTASLYLFCNAFYLNVSWLIYLAYAVAAMTIISGIHYLIKGVKSTF
ncbi:MAG: CDP-diacylglycerol--glycerol-3-phosphate 3-phosphatidyltransferase [Acidobacteria bacterium CG_4_9_14_3_um_filter_49_7]|nr:MAG: CDP-diacylglycerol--glycerol-3-phosphate 3-phosphatidyltransferase [Acidobacteria bacterium CG_4_9_14_3_um_filter_49_7]